MGLRGAGILERWMFDDFTTTPLVSPGELSEDAERPGLEGGSLHPKVGGNQPHLQRWGCAKQQQSSQGFFSFVLKLKPGELENMMFRLRSTSGYYSECKCKQNFIRTLAVIGNRPRHLALPVSVCSLG